jgi:SAM-dependent methyltransferase
VIPSASQRNSTTVDRDKRRETEEWGTYRKLIENNYINQRDAYDRLHAVVTDQAPAGFRFLDVACGDASLTVEALLGTAVGQYYGIELSPAAIYFAARSLRSLSCPRELVTGDMIEVLADWQKPVDVTWIGLSLHHFASAQKRQIMSEIHRLVAPSGLFLIYENSSPDGEDRDGWLQRWDACRTVWTELSDDGWMALNGHVHSSDYPETDSGWRQLGMEAGFSEARTLFVSPTDLFRMFSFRA